ncbi:COMPASS, Set1C complex protein, partial [Aureobasidium melanogenum]
MAESRGIDIEAWRQAIVVPRNFLGVPQDSPDTLVNDLRSGHATTLRFSRKGDYLASGRVDGKVVIWDMETMGVAMKLHGHWKQIQSLSWSREGRYLLSASQDCRAILWDLQTQERLRTVKFEAPIYTAELHPYNHNLLIASLFEDRPHLVDITNPEPIKRILPTTPLSDSIPRSEKKQATTSAIFSVLGNHIITGTSKGYINILETESRKIIHSTKVSSGLISLLRLTSNGRQLLANSTDRIIRVINLPDLSLITPSRPANVEHQQPTSSTANTPGPNTTTASAEEDEAQPDPATLAENIVLTTEHKFQDLVNRLRWNHCAFSHSSSTGIADYVTASTYMKKDIYIWELRTNSLLRILENREEPAIIEWHPSRPLLACTSIETGSIQIWGIEPQQKWSALAPDFTELTENVEYVEREDEFDTYPQEEHQKRRLDREDEIVDVLTVERKPGEEETFVLPMIYDIEDSDADDQELVPMGVGTMRKRDINEGKEYENDADEVAKSARRQRK